MSQGVLTQGSVLERIPAGQAGGKPYRIALETTIGDRRARDPETLADKIGGPLARRLMKEWLEAGGRLHRLCDEGPPEDWPVELQERYAAAVALVRAADRSRPPRPGPWKNPEEIAAYLQRHLPLRNEHFGVLLLDNNHQLLRDEVIAEGKRDGCYVDVGNIMRMALAADAGNLVTWHNHPAQTTTPSPEDIVIWERIEEAGRLLDVHCLDHLILTTPSGAFYSRARAEPGLMQKQRQTESVR